MSHRSLPALFACAALLGSFAGTVSAQQYPTRIIRVVNPNQPGGNSDVLFRQLAPKMGEILGQQLVIDYRPGAGGNIGAEVVSKAQPDGYTTLIAAASFLINPSLLKNIPFDAVRDFTPLGLIVDIPAGLFVHPSLPAKNAKDLIALAKKRPGELNYSSSGRGAVGHLSGALLESTTGIKVVHIPYKGAGPSIADLVAGHVHFTFASIPAAAGHVHAGRLRLIAQCGDKRFPSFAEVPTMVESGVQNFVVSSAFSFLGPAKMPQPIVNRLNDALVKALRDPANNAALVKQGAQPIGNSPAEHAAFIKTEIEKWRKIARTAGIDPE